MSALPVSPAPPQPLEVFPRRVVVDCAGCHRYTVERLCACPADLTSWFCPFCADRSVEDEPAHQTRWMNGYIEPYARRYFQTLKPRAIDNTQRAYPSWALDDAKWRIIAAYLRKGRNGPQDEAIAAWYWRAALSTAQISGLLGMSVKAVEMRIERIKAKVERVALLANQR